VAVATIVAVGAGVSGVSGGRVAVGGGSMTG
jgi:hypothetical protein